MAASASGIGGRPGRVRGGQRCDAKRCEAKRCEAVRSGAKRCEAMRSGAVTGSGRAGRQGGRAAGRCGVVAVKAVAAAGQGSTPTARPRPLYR